MRVKKVNIEEKKVESRKSKKVEYEMVKNVVMRKNRLDTVLTVDSQGNILSIVGDNPKQNKIGDNIYE
jgi:hypothetical protein